MSDIKTLTVRLPISIYERAAGLAKARGRSMNRLVQDALRLLDSQESEKRLFDDFTRIAEADGGETDVGFALEAQAEILGA